MGTARRLGLFVAVGLGLATAARAAEPADKFGWFRKAKFGLFVHWGPYAVPAGEWGDKKDYGEWIMLSANIPSKEYEGLARQLNPVKFDAKEWVGLAKDAGMNYIVVTAKHHDGFCMYDSKLTDYDIVDYTPWKRDPFKELAEESRKAGIKFCPYYSIVDWHHPEFPQGLSQVRREHPDGFHGAPNPKADIKKYAEYQKGQVRELLTNYGDVGIVWFDGGGSFRNRDRKALLDGKALVDMIRELRPGILINNRLGFGGDYGTPEQHIPGGASAHPFEVCMTLNRHWGYNKNDNDWKSSETIIRNLVDIASKGGNYLLNVGPTAEGVIPEASQRILREVGQWLKVNGEAIYDSAAGPSNENVRGPGSTQREGTPNGIRFTQQPGKLYMTVLDWPKGDGSIFVEGLKGSVVGKMYFLGDPEKKAIEADLRERCVKFKLPATRPAGFAPVIVIERRGDEPLEDSIGTQASVGAAG
jgi:alpha-L-fucosidase